MQEQLVVQLVDEMAVLEQVWPPPGEVECGGIDHRFCMNDDWHRLRCCAQQ